MFKLTKPCANCPFRKGQGERFNLGVDRVLEILNATAFQCHKTVDYSDEGDPQQGTNPQQCAGAMSLLHRANLPNQIMQVGERLGQVDFDKLDHTNVYDNIADALEAHSGGDVDWAEQAAAFDPYAHPERWEREYAGVPSEPTRGRMPDFKRAWERWGDGESRYH